MAIVAILLINMLIAMMGNTYQKIAETRNEWQRQWARIVLVVERGVSPPERLKQLNVYSQPMSDGKRALVLRLNQSVRFYKDSNARLIRSTRYIGYYSCLKFSLFLRFSSSSRSFWVYWANNLRLILTIINIK